ncbi:MAG: glycosyltransferase family 39 protein, partial [Planctomycetaceae bacterium]|nr:glycosyltransferase family 39 protein [Planctomycetaceae bacterium]
MKCIFSLSVFFVLLSIYSFLLIYSAWNNSPVMSEDAHLASGVSHHKFQRFDLYRVNPPLVRFLVVLPAKGKLASQENVWWRYDTSSLKRSEFEIGIDVVRYRSDYKTLIFQSRLLAILIFGLIGFLTCFYFAKNFAGQIVAIIVLVLYCFSPYILGHGSTIMPDAHSASFAVASVYFFWRWLKRPEALASLIAGIVLGLAELTKFTLIIFYPLFVVMWLIYRLPEIKTLTKK